MSISSRERKHIEVLQKRAEFLNRRIYENPDRDLSYDRAEVAALRWAVDRGNQEKEIRMLVASHIMANAVFEYETNEEAADCAIKATDVLLERIENETKSL